MSSLLDVLHKRPSRAQLAAAAEQAALPELPATELRLAPELELAAATQVGRSPAPAVDLPVNLPAAEPSAAPASPSGETSLLRRWSDPPVAAAEPVRAAPAAAASAPATGRPRMMLAVLLAASVVFAAFLAWQFTGQEQEGFLAAPGDVPPATDAAAGPQADAPPPAAPAVPAKKPRRPRPEAVADGPVAGTGQEAWYDQPALPAEASAVEEAPVIRISRGETRDPLFEKLSGAYAALQAGDDATAEKAYREVLAANAGSVDALLGLATLAARQGRSDEARDLYRGVQRLDPKNPTAAAALSALPGPGAATVSESQLKGMLREQPGAGTLHFALGLRYLAEQRWPDAQAAFFEAVRHEPTNADYAFNLAVSLDRLGQSAAAASYYQRAVDLATGGQQFDPVAALARLEALRAAGT